MFWITKRILQLVHGQLVDGSHAVVDKGATQEDCQGKDPGVVLVVSLDVIGEPHGIDRKSAMLSIQVDKV